MRKNYLKVALHHLCKYICFSAINIAGLAIVVLGELITMVLQAVGAAVASPVKLLRIE